MYTDDGTSPVFFFGSFIYWKKRPNTLTMVPRLYFFICFYSIFLFFYFIPLLLEEKAMYTDNGTRLYFFI